MKILCTLLLLSITTLLSAQTPFEGKIRYTATMYDKPEKGEVIIYYGKPGIRLEFIELKKPQATPEILIINFDSGSIFTLRPANTYRSAVLKKKPQALATSKEIAGFKTLAVSIDAAGMGGNLAGIFGSSTLYAANDLLYPIPVGYSSAPELLMITNGKIVLGGDFYLPDYSSGEWPRGETTDSSRKQQKLFSVVATEVSRQPLDHSLFVVPADYTKESTDYFTDSAMVDTTGIYADTTVSYAVKPPSKKNKKPSKKAPSKSKQQALRRKND